MKPNAFICTVLFIFFPSAPFVSFLHESAELALLCSDSELNLSGTCLFFASYFKQNNIMSFMNQKTNEPICHILQECHSESLFLTLTGTGKLLHVNRLTEMSKQEWCIKELLYSFSTMFARVWSFIGQLGTVWALEFKQNVQIWRECKGILNGWKIEPSLKSAEIIMFENYCRGKWKPEE